MRQVASTYRALHCRLGSSDHAIPHVLDQGAVEGSSKTSKEDHAFVHALLDDAIMLLAGGQTQSREAAGRLRPLGQALESILRYSSQTQAFLRRSSAANALSLPTCRNLWRRATACQARLDPRMAEYRQSGTRPYDDVVVNVEECGNLS